MDVKQKLIYIIYEEQKRFAFTAYAMSYLGRHRQEYWAHGVNY